MMGITAFRIGLGEDDPVARDLVHGADMLIVIADHFHMLADAAEHAALLLPPLAPAAKVAFEPRPVLGTIVVIVAVKLGHVPLPPRIIMRVLVARAVRPVGRAGPAGAAIFVAAPGALGAVEVAIVAAEAAFAAAVIARHRAIAAAALAIPVAVAIAGSRKLLAP